MTRNALPTVLQELQRFKNMNAEEINELLRFYDDFEQLREEDIQTQAHSYAWTKDGAESLSQRLRVAKLKATYLPEDTNEFLMLPGRLGANVFPRGVYDIPLQVCDCIWDHWECYFPKQDAAWVKLPRDLPLTLRDIAVLQYEQKSPLLSVDKMKESHHFSLRMRSKKMLAHYITLFIDLGLIQGSPPENRFSLPTRFEFAPLFAKLRTLQWKLRGETFPDIRSNA